MVLLTFPAKFEVYLLGQGVGLTHLSQLVLDRWGR
jgi:hypothetical protein